MTIDEAVISISVSTTLNFALADAAQVDHGEQQHERHRGDGDRGVALADVHAEAVEAGQQVHRQQVRGGGGAGDAGADDRERHEERHEVQAERLVRVERGARGLRYFVTSSR